MLSRQNVCVGLNIRRSIHSRATTRYLKGSVISNASSTSFSLTNTAISQIRCKTWFNPLSKFNSKAKINSIVEVPVSDRIMVEEPVSETIDQKKINGIKHYIRSNDIPPNLKKNILKTKLSEIIQEMEWYSPTTIRILNDGFLSLYELNDYKIKTENDQILDSLDLFKLFETTSLSLINDGKSLKIPKYMSILIQFLLNQESVIPTSILIYIVELGSIKSNFELVLMNLANKLKINDEFIVELMKYYKSKKTLSISKFELVVSIASRDGPKSNESKPSILNEKFYQIMIEYIEGLFKHNLPKVHEYQNLELNIARIQLLVNNLMAGVDRENVSALLKLVKLAYELNQVEANHSSNENIHEIMDYLVEEPNEIKFHAIRNELFIQDLFDESLAESLLLISWSSPKYRKLGTMLCEYFQSDDIKFSKELRLQAKILESFENEASKGEEKKVTNIINILNEYPHEIDYNELYSNIIKFAMASGISPRGYFTQTLGNHFINTYRTEHSVYSYKYRLDKAIENDNYVQAVNIFDDSVQNLAQWSDILDPAVSCTLNNLIVLICKNMEDVVTIFPIFTKIKQQMVNSQCNIDAIKALSYRMLQSECIGDLIEFLKRELPSIDKDSLIKLPIDKPYGTKYLELFTMLHDFVITYNNENTHETNWVLYGELHKYFHVPFDSYLPAMKFFCENKRWNAALIVFRQIRKMNELHGNHTFLPPLRDMYLYLFQEFGDKLYEEGVIEVHEHIKMDINIPQQDIMLQNAILNAYSNLQDVARARELFLSMSTNPKQIGGINEESIQIMIKTYTYNDLAYVQKFWNNLSQFQIIPNYAIYRQYLIAHVYHGLVDEALALTEGMDDYDLEITSDTLLSLHNFCLEERGQRKVAQWAAENHKDKWDNLINSDLLVGATNYAPSNNLIAETTT